MSGLISAGDFIGKESRVTAWLKDNASTVVAWGAAVVVLGVAWGVHTAEFREVDAHVDDLVVTLNKLHHDNGDKNVRITEHSAAIRSLDRRVVALETSTATLAQTLTRVEVLVAKLEALVVRLDDKGLSP